MIITDIHAHVFPDRLADKAAHSIGDFYGTPMYSAASVDRLLAEDGEADISYSVICNSAVTPHQVHDVNNFLAAAAASHPSFIGFGSIYPGMDGFEEELDRMMALGLRGLKIHPEFQKLPIDDPSGIETYRAVAKRGLPVLFHMGDDRFDLSTPQRLMNLLRQVPDLHVIAAHFGGWRAWELRTKPAAGKRALRHLRHCADDPAGFRAADARPLRCGAVFVRLGFPDVEARVRGGADSRARAGQ